MENQEKFRSSIDEYIDYWLSLRGGWYKEQIWNTILVMDKITWYEQSAWKKYHTYLGWLHSKEETMIWIFDTIYQYINSQQKLNSNKHMEIVDFGWWNGVLLCYIKNKLQDLGLNLENIKFTVMDANKKQLDGIENNIATVQADITNEIPKKQIDIAISRNVFHYIEKGKQYKTIKNIYNSLKKWWIFINGFISVSEDAQEEINNYRTEFATRVNTKWILTERYVSTVEEMEKNYRDAWFKDVHYFLWFENHGIMRWLEWFEGKYPTLTKTDVLYFENLLENLPENIKIELKVRSVVNSAWERTMDIVHPVFIIVGVK